MIPIQLKLKNFLPYRAPDPLIFDGIHLACLTGMNGAGKSSLLDAITWALWGKARGKRDDDLIHLGQADMFVQLDFEHENIKYRVLRQRTRSKRGQSTLDLFVFAGDGALTTISEPSIRQTQGKINDLLRLDYDIFIHSAFLQQGKADAFTTRTPAERKKILSDILGLERWADYEEEAKKRLKEIEANLLYFDGRIHEINLDLQQQPALEADLAAATESHATITTTLGTAEALAQELQHAPGELRATQSTKAETERRLSERNTDLQAVEERIAHFQAQLLDYQEVIDAAEDIEAGYAALQSAREADQQFSEKLSQLISLKDQRTQLQTQVDTARTRLESEAKSIQQRIIELEGLLENDYTADLESVQIAVAELQALEAERDVLDEKVVALREENSTLEAEKKTLTAEGQAVGERRDQLLKTDGDAVTCPLCGQPLEGDHLAQITEQVEAEYQAKRAAYTEIGERIITVNDEMKIHRAEIQKMNLELKRLSPLIERAGKLQLQVESVQETTIQLEQQKQQVEMIQDRLDAEDFAVDVREELALLDEKQTALDYDSDSHDEARQDQQAYTQYEQLYTRLSVAKESLSTIQHNIDDAQSRRERLLKSVLEIQAEITALDADIIRLTEDVRLFHEREAEVRIYRTQERSAYERVISARQSLDALEKQAERKIEFELKRDDARQQETLHNELKRAFGKNGVPAMIIETAIPELESAANRLLGRMTSGRMSLRLNTQREKITGGIAETLDIEIADELGTRSYEMYSGGEAFRVNFALRVSLSQMLARRAGAHLRTLFIDEGFGTQDEEGRNKLVEAINVIQDEFDMVLVITHIDELRDSFPVHIVIDKTDNGSRIVLR